MAVSPDVKVDFVRKLAGRVIKLDVDEPVYSEITRLDKRRQFDLVLVRQHVSGDADVPHVAVLGGQHVERASAEEDAGHVLVEAALPLLRLLVFNLLNG